MSKTCSVEGCNSKHYGKGYCNKHYQQYRRYGHILDRTKYDSNEIIEYVDYAEVILYDKDGNETARTLIDLEDVDLVKQHKWCYDRINGYAVNGSSIRLHRFIMNCPCDLVVDHINHNKLDNRKENLRICTCQENSFNRSISNNNTNQAMGVEKISNKWRAYIDYNYRRIHLGSFDSLEEAIATRRQAEIEYFGEFAPNNEG